MHHGPLMGACFAPCLQVRRRHQKRLVVDTIQHLLGSMKNRLQVVNERIANVEEEASDSSLDDL